MQNRHRKGQASIGFGIANLDNRLAGIDCHQLVVHNTDHIGLGGSELQQFTPGGAGINHGLQGIHFVGAEGQALFQTIEIEIHIVIGQADLVGSIVQCIVVAGNRKCILVGSIFLDLIDVIRQFIGHISGAVALRIHRGHKLLKVFQLRDGVAIFVCGIHNTTHLCCHCKMVIVNGHLCIQAVLLQSLVVLVVELHIRQRGCLKVDHQREFKGVLLVGLQCTLVIVHIAHQLHRILGVVGQIIVLGVKFDFNVGRIDRTAIAVGFTDILVHCLENHFAGYIVGNGNLNPLCGTEHTSPHKAQRMDGTVPIGKGDVIAICRDHNILGILQEVVGTQIADIVAFHAADGTGSISISHGLVLEGQALIQFVSVGLVVIQVEHGSLSPVAVESQVRNIQVHCIAIGVLQSNKAFHIYTVFKRLVQVCLVLFRQGDGNSHIHCAACCYRDLIFLDLCAAHSHLDICALQNVSDFCNGGLAVGCLCLRNTFRHHICADGIGAGLITKVVHSELQRVNTGLILVVTQLNLGLVHHCAGFILCGDESIGLQCVKQIGKACALLTNRIGLAIGVEDDICCGHQKLIDHCRHFHIVVCNLREILYHILTHEDDNACQVGASHTGTGQTVVTAAGDRGENVAAMCSQLRLDLQIGSGAPRGEVRNERTGCLLAANLELAGGGSQQLAVILRNGADSQLCLTHIHLDFAGHIVVDNNAGCALIFSDHRLFFKGVVATAYQNDFSLNIQTGIVSTSADTGDHDIFIFSVNSVTQQSVKETQLLGSAVVCFIEIDDGIAMQQIRSGCAIDGGDGHCALVSRGGTDRTGIGVGGQGQVTIGLGTICRRVAVGCCYHNADAGSTNFVVHTAEDFLIRLSAEAAGSTQAHIDDIHAQNDAVFQCCQDPCASCSIHNIGEDFHGHQLCIGGNTDDGVIITHDHAGNMGAVIVVGGVGIGILVCIVIAERHFIVDKHIVNSQALGQGSRSGVANDLGNIRIGQTQLLRCEVFNRECTVLGVQTGIQNSNHHAAAIVAGAFTLENTGIIHIDLVFNQFCFRRLIFLAYDDAGAFAQGLTGYIKILRLNHQLKASDCCAVFFTCCISHTGLVQRGQNFRLAVIALADDCCSLFAVQRKFREAHGLVCGFISIQQILLIQRNNHGDLVIWLDRIRELLHHGGIQKILVIYFQITGVLPNK